MILAALALAGSVSGTPPLPARIEASIDDVATRYGLSGEIVVARQDKVLLDKNYGPTATQRKARSDVAQRWRWASVTKQIVAILVMQEVAKGRIDLDQPIATYLPAFVGPTAKTATVRQLLRHQAGLPNPDDTAPDADSFPAYYLAGYTGSRDPLTGYCAGPAKGAPGGPWSYNNCDYIVAGALLRAVTGKSWSTLVSERIIRPLGLKTVGVYPTRLPTRSGFYDGKPEPVIDMTSYQASAGLFGAPHDLIRIDQALMNDKLLPKRQLDELWDGQPKLGYIALGQWVFEAKLKNCPAPVRIVERRGAIGGVEVRNFMLPQRKAAMVIFTDRSPLDFGEIWQGKGLSYEVLDAAFCTGASQ